MDPAIAREDISELTLTHVVREVPVRVTHTHITVGGWVGGEEQHTPAAAARRRTPFVSNKHNISHTHIHTHTHTYVILLQLFHTHIHTHSTYPTKHTHPGPPPILPNLTLIRASGKCRWKSTSLSLLPKDPIWDKTREREQHTAAKREQYTYTYIHT